MSLGLLRIDLMVFHTLFLKAFRLPICEGSHFVEKIRQNKYANVNLALTVLVDPGRLKVKFMMIVPVYLPVHLCTYLP